MKTKERENKAKDITRRTILICYLAWFIPGLAKWLLNKLNERQLRAAFHSAYEFMLQGKFWFTSKSPLWFTIFDRWLEICNTEHLVKGLFFEANYQFLDEKGKDTENPLKTAAIEKLLTFATDWRNSEHQTIVWNLHYNWGVMMVWRGGQLANARRVEFAKSMLASATNSAQAVRAMDFARSRHVADEKNSTFMEAWVLYRQLEQLEHEAKKAKLRDRYLLENAARP